MTQLKTRIKKGDQVIVLTGKDKGAKGEVLKVLRGEDPNKTKVIVQGVNIATLHTKPSQGSTGGIEKKEKPVHISNVALSDPKTGKATRVGQTTLKDGRKMRVAKKSGETVE